MTAEHYRTVILKHWRLIILCGLLLGIGTAVGTLFIPPVYKSTVTLQLVTAPPDVTIVDTTFMATRSTLATDRIIQTEISLVTTQPILTQVASQYPGLTTGQLESEISAQQVTGANVFQITVSDRNQGRAAGLANALASALISQQQHDTQQATAQSQQPLQDQIAATQKQMDADQATLNNLEANKSANQQQIQQLQSELSDLQKQYNQELQTLSDVQSNEARTATFLQVAQAANLGTSTSRFGLLLGSAAAALGVGLLLGLFFVLARDLLDQQVRTVPALNELLGWPLLAELSASAAKQGNQDGGTQTGETSNLIAYQMLQKNLAFLGLDAPLFSIMMTSALRDGTANAVAGNLALLLAREGKQVVLVDANFSKPSQSRRFGLASEPGLSDAILAFNASGDGEKSLQPYMYRANNAPASLQVLPAGSIPPNPGQVLKSQAMKAVLQALGETGADVVVLVTPPVAGSADVATFAAQADGTIVMVERARARRDKLARMKLRLEEAGTRVLGYVVCDSTSPGQAVPAEQRDTLENVQIG